MAKVQVAPEVLSHTLFLSRAIKVNDITLDASTGCFVFDIEGPDVPDANFIVATFTREKEYVTFRSVEEEAGEVVMEKTTVDKLLSDLLSSGGAAATFTHIPLADLARKGIEEAQSPVDKLMSAIFSGDQGSPLWNKIHSGEEPPPPKDPRELELCTCSDCVADRRYKHTEIIGALSLAEAVITKHLDEDEFAAELDILRSVLKENGGYH